MTTPIEEISSITPFTENEENFDLNKIRQYLLSQEFLKSMEYFLKIIPSTLMITTGGRKLKLKNKSKKTKKGHYRHHKTKKYGGTEMTNSNIQTYRNIIIIFLLISLAIPANYVPKLFETILTSSHEKLQTYIFTPLSTSFPKITEGLSGSLGAKLLMSVIKYPQVAIVKNFTDFSNGSVLMICGVWGLYNHMKNLYSFLKSNNNINQNMNVEKEVKIIDKKVDELAKLVDKGETQLFKVPDGSKLLIPIINK